MIKIENIVTNTLAIAFVITLFIFAFIWIVFEFQGSANSLKDTWSIVASLISGLTTLVASYIAYYIYSQWKLQAEYNHKLQDLKEIIDVIYELKEEIENLRAQKSIISLMFNIRKISSIREYESQKDQIEILVAELRTLNMLFHKKTILGKLNAKIFLLYENDKNYENFNNDLKKLFTFLNTFSADYSKISDTFSIRSLITSTHQEWYDHSIKVSNLIFQVRKILVEDNIVINEVDPINSFYSLVENLLSNIKLMSQDIR